MILGLLMAHLLDLQTVVNETRRHSKLIRNTKEGVVLEKNICLTLVHLDSLCPNFSYV